MPKPSWGRTWAALAASAALILAIVAVQNARHPGAKLNPKQPTPVNDNSLADVKPLANASPKEIGGLKTTGRWRRRQDQRPGTVFVAEAQALVAAGQRQAVDQLIAGLQRGELKGEILLRQSWNGEIEDLQVSPIEVPPLPATSVDEGSPGTN